jgi:hypothetical protein
MKLTIRWRDVAPSPALLEHVKSALSGSIRPHPWSFVSLRVSLLGDGTPRDPWIRCRVEVALRGGGLRIVEAASSDALVAIDAAADRVATMRPQTRPPRVRPAAEQRERRRVHQAARISRAA